MTDEEVGAAELVEFIGAEPTASERRISAGNRSQRKGKRAARKLMAAAVAAAALVVVPSATATIHPIAVGWVSGNASGDPPRRHARHHALGSVDVATSCLTITSTGPVLDISIPASKFSTPGGRSVAGGTASLALR